jgi:Uma2 family endonuclease
MTIDVGVERRRFTLDEYHRMGEAGILHEDDPVELVHGEIVQTAPIGPTHAWCVTRLSRLLDRTLGNRAVVRSQSPVTLPPDSEAQPDVALLRPPEEAYRRRHPLPDDVLLLVEVADRSIRYDRGLKRRLYARAGIREYWLVDLDGAGVEVYREPAGDDYRRVDRLGRDERLTLEVVSGVSVPVADVLG